MAQKIVLLFQSEMVCEESKWDLNKIIHNKSNQEKEFASIKLDI